MHAQKGTEWSAIPTELDALWCPTLEFASGCAEADVYLLFGGGSNPTRPEFPETRYYVLRFSQVEMAAGYGESTYHLLAEVTPGTRSFMSEVVASKLAAEITGFRGGPLKHFSVASGGMHCEVVASPDFELQRFDSREAALLAARDGFEHKTKNFDASSPEALELLRSLGVGT